MNIGQIFLNLWNDSGLSLIASDFEVLLPAGGSELSLLWALSQPVGSC